MEVSTSSKRQSVIWCYPLYTKNAGLQEQQLQSSIIFYWCLPLLRYAQLDITYVNAVESAVKLSSL